MSIGIPIRLGSAAQPLLIFQEGSTITISDSGIQECAIKALCPDGKNVFNYIPAAGTSYNAIFANDYLPSDFKVDRSKNSSIQIDYNKGTTATITLSFKRPDPDKTGADSRKVSFDTQFRHIGDIVAYILSSGVSGLDDTQRSFGMPGLPEPVVTVRYNNPTLPTIGSGGFAISTSNDGLGGTSPLAARGGGTFTSSGSSQAAGFPICEPVVLPYSGMFVASGTGCITSTTADFNFVPNPVGWQLVGLASEPVADKSFFDVTETWRMNYIFTGVSSIHETINGQC